MCDFGLQMNWSKIGGVWSKMEATPSSKCEGFKEQQKAGVISGWVSPVWSIYNAEIILIFPCS